MAQKKFWAIFLCAPVIVMAVHYAAFLKALAPALFNRIHLTQQRQAHWSQEAFAASRRTAPTSTRQVLHNFLLIHFTKSSSPMTSRIFRRFAQKYFSNKNGDVVPFLAAGS